MLVVSPIDSAAFGAEPISRLTGAILNERYELLELIGSGGMGAVFKARQIGVERLVAVKVLHDRLIGNESLVKRFENEARAVSQLRHPNTVRLYDWQRTPSGELFIVTELMSGVPLSRVLVSDGRIAIERALRITEAVCRSLSEAHGAGIIHRDLKPENVFIDHVGADDIVKVLDFGLAKFEGGHEATLPGRVAGTPHYMAPEQIRGEDCDGRTDVYAIGVLLYEMISGVTPFTADTALSLFDRHVNAPPPRLSERMPEAAIPPELDDLVLDMLAKQPSQRPKSVDEVRDRIEVLLSKGSEVALALTPSASWLPLGSTPRDERPTEIDPSPVETASVATVRPPSNARAVLAIIAVAVVAALASLLAVLMSGAKTVPSPSVRIEPAAPSTQADPTFEGVAPPSEPKIEPPPAAPPVEKPRPAQAAQPARPARPTRAARPRAAVKAPHAPPRRIEQKAAAPQLGTNLLPVKIE
jgi:eukaryotic-like serine/threonine-protein kinase